MSVAVLDRHIEITPGVANGKPRIAGRRITVQNIVVWHEHLGKNADEICAEYSTRDRILRSPKTSANSRWQQTPSVSQKALAIDRH
ncbi:DUF433 domain-containing protein [Candidatus Amarolinea dominans]|uniref:DUF433 domain-containing protein n=1 Tax=Candidatus Amarolinea dominans TaxID=3140696 RepID=UPI0031349AEE|nr:DUF433 domain-containing protein [Anaerolineae bacterium]